MDLMQPDATVAHSEQQYCSFAVTGAHKSFQAIYVCQSCCTEDNVLCLCQACADSCHADCDGLEYIGMGQSYCDCHDIATGCQIQQASVEEATRLKTGSALDNILRRQGEGDGAKFVNAPEYVMDACSIPFLIQDDTLHATLCGQAEEIIKHSRETFWIDAGVVQETVLSGLEQMAWAIFQRHFHEYKLDNVENLTNNICGAEWWVQVKPISYPDTQDDASSHTDGKEAIDLHYDKDEVLAETFGLGLFPTLSTVTYLTQSQSASPTVVLSHRYNQSEADPISTMLVSHPRRGKHIVFDGTLLHGAPSHYALREPCQHQKLADDGGCRVTFLVNLWVGHHPAGVKPLDANVRGRLKSQVLGNDANQSLHLTFMPQSIPRRALHSVDNLGEANRERIHLPFLSKGATWESQDDISVQLVLSTFVPPPIPGDETTVQVNFGSGMEAIMATLFDENESDNSDDQS